MYDLSNPLLDLIHPVGSIYWSTNITSPETLFGGTWEQIKDTFILAAGDSYSAGSTGGEANHTLTIDELPSHRHSTYSLGATTSPGTSSSYYVAMRGVDYSNQYGDTCLTNAVGGSSAHNNMPPYLVAYCWKRTA